MLFSNVQTDTEKVRIDSGFYSKKYLNTIQALQALPCGVTLLGRITRTLRKGVFDIKAESYVDEGIPFVRIANLKNATISDANLAFISPGAHAGEQKTALERGDFILSKTAYPAASWVAAAECNTSQDTIACQLTPKAATQFDTRFLVVYLNSRFGLAIVERLFQGNVQLHLSLPDAATIPIPNLSRNFQRSVVSVFGRSLESSEIAKGLQGKAEGVLLDALKLANWNPPQARTYEKPASIALSAGRLDAEFFHPRIDGLFHRLGDRKQTIGDVARLRKERFQPGPFEFNYLEIGAVSSGGVVADSILDGDDAPSRATWRVHHGDIVTSTVRPIRGLSAMIEPHQENAVASSGFAVLEPVGVSPELLLCYLKLPVICELMDLHTSASMYPAISVPDILNLPFKHPGAEAEGEIVELVQEARVKRQHSRALLDRAKRAVEIAIEQDEETALAYLDGKHYVADELLPKLFGLARHYVDLDTIQRTLEAEAIHYEPATIKRYLHEWQSAGRIHDAGRGWYSDLPEAFVPDPDIGIIGAVQAVLEKEFPLLDRTIWSTRELTGFFHHVPTRHAAFLMVDRDAFEPVADALRDAGIRVVVHPLGEMAKRFALEDEDTVILRPRLSSDHTEPRSPIEHTLVDLYHEIQKLGLYEGEEFRRIVHNLATTRRVNITALKRYAERRKIDSEAILGAFL